MQIRIAQNTDLAGILQLYAQPNMDDGLILPLPEAEAILARMQRYPNYHVFVAQDGGAIVGSFALLVMDNLAHRGTPSAIVEDVVVAPDRQGQGIGKKMMAYAITRAKAAGCYKLMLSSNAKREAAHHFYESLGFVRHGYSFRMDLVN